MHVDFKITTWERVSVPEEREEEVKQKIESGEISSASELCDFLEGDAYSEKLFDVDEQMTPEENGGSSTIELYEETGKNPMWTNGDC